MIATQLAGFDIAGIVIRKYDIETRQQGIGL